MAQDQGTYPGLCLLTDSDGKVITIEDSVSHDTVVFTHTNTGEGEFAICYPEVLGSGVPVAALANFGTHAVENTATQGYAFTLGDEEYLVRQNVIAPTPGEINDVLYSRSLVVDSSTMDVLVTEDGSVVSYFNGELDVCFVKFTNGEWHAETAYYDQIVEASGSEDSVSIGCTVADGVYTIKYGFNTYVLEEDSLTPEVAEWVDTVVSRFYAYGRNTATAAYGLPLVLLAMKSGNIKCAGVTVKNVMLGGELQDVIAPLFGTRAYNPLQDGYSGSLKAIIGNQYQKGMRSLLYDDNWYEQNVLGLTTDDIESVGEYDYNNNEPGNSIEIPQNIELTLPSYVPKVIVNTNPTTGLLNEVTLYSSVEAQDVMSDIVLVSQDGNVTFVENNDEWNMVQNSNNIGTCTAEDASISLTTSNTSQITSVLYDPD